MEIRDFGQLGPVSALTLGGGGIGGVLGPTDRAEAVATVHAAIDAGITSLDVAPTYGTDNEAEQVVGAALRARPAPEVMITTKVELPDDEDDDLPTFVRLQEEGLIRGWGLTAVGYPPAILAALAAEPRPYAAQMVVNALDLSGDMWIFGDAGQPQNPTLVAAAADAGVPVMAIRAVASGALTDQLDREPNDPTREDYDRAAGFRALAADLGQTPATLAHRYALSVPGVATVVLGVKNRTELAEVVAAEAAGPLSEAEWQAIIELC